MKAILVSILFAAAAYPVTITIQNPNVQSFPGGSVNFLFTAGPDSTSYVSYVSSFLINESDAALGSYLDNIGLLGGPVNFSHAPGAKTWSGIAGTYQVSPWAVVGATNNATLRVLYELHSDDPLQCGNCWLDTKWKDVAVSITVAPVPEPGSLLLIGLAGVALLLQAGRR